MLTFGFSGENKRLPEFESNAEFLKGIKLFGEAYPSYKFGFHAFNLLFSASCRDNEVSR